MKKRQQAILAGLIYRTKRGEAIGSQRKFNCVSPAQDWQKSWFVGDVWICDEAGNIDPGKNVSPVPIRREAIGLLIGRMPAAD
jgi:hypothetical protein